MNPTSGVLGEAWGLYKTHWQRFAILALAVYVVIGLASALLIEMAGVFGALLATVVSLVGVFLLQGAFVNAVLDVRAGRVDMTVGVTMHSMPSARTASASAASTESTTSTEAIGA